MQIESLIRIDKLLWYLRFTKTRGIAQAMVQTGHMRLNGTRVTKASQAVAIGDIVTLPLGPKVLTFALLSLPQRRGPAPEAQSCYRVLDGGTQLPLAAAEHQPAAEEDLQP